jgi:hypothetical protein
MVVSSWGACSGRSSRVGVRHRGLVFVNQWTQEVVVVVLVLSCPCCREGGAVGRCTVHRGEGRCAPLVPP